MKAVRIDLTGEQFGRLKVVEYAGTDKEGKSLWKCQCTCGNVKAVRGRHLRCGSIKSCGCLQKELASERIKKHPTKGNTKHGQSKSRLYQIWTNMKTRCYNKANRAFKWYGAVGITICPEWFKFENFMLWAMSTGYKDDLTIERIDPFGNYEPNNCTWIPKSEQRKNQRRCKK